MNFFGCGKFRRLGPLGIRPAPFFRVWYGLWFSCQNLRIVVWYFSGGDDLMTLKELQPFAVFGPLLQHLGLVRAWHVPLVEVFVVGRRSDRDEGWDLFLCTDYGGSDLLKRNPHISWKHSDAIYHHFGNWRAFFLYINIIYILAFGMFFLGLIPKLGGPHFPLGNFQGKNPWEIAGFEARRRCRSCTWAIAIWRGQRNHWIWSCQRCRSWTCDMAINVLMGQKWGGGRSQFMMARVGTRLFGGRCFLCWVLFNGGLKRLGRVEL